jgi:hypothetical protein
MEWHRTSAWLIYPCSAVEWTPGFAGAWRDVRETGIPERREWEAPTHLVTGINP